MHPFLKHQVLSKSMRELLGSPKERRSKRLDLSYSTTTEKPNEGDSEHPSTTADEINRSKRLDLYYPTTTEVDKSRRDNLNPLFLAIKRGSDDKVEERGCDMLGTVLKEIQEIKYGKMLQSDAECALNGSWSAEVAGRRIDVISKNGVPSVKLRRPLQKRRRGILGLEAWNATIRIPFKRKTNYVILTATNDRAKVVATFMGECRICRSKPIVQGQWLLARHSRDCEGLGATEQLIADVWRQEKLCQIQDNHLDSIKNKKNCKKKMEGTTMPTCNTTT